MTDVNVILSAQDLGDFLEENQEYMEAYRAELEKRLTDYFDNANVEIDNNALSDKIETDDYENETSVQDQVNHVMNQMVNDWSWLPEVAE